MSNSVIDPEPKCSALHGCGRPSDDGFLCRGCTSRLERILAELPATLADLTTTITRQAKTSRAAGGKATKAAESPLPFDVHASELAGRVRNGLGTWIRHLCESRGAETLSGPTHSAGGCQHESCHLIRQGMPRLTRTEDMATWLVAHIEAIRQDESAPELLADLEVLQAELRAAVDNRETKFAGQCTTVLAVGDLIHDDDVITVVPSERACGALLRMRPGSSTVTCRACKASYPALEISRRILMQSLEFQGTATFIAHALTDAGYPVKAETIRKWAERSRAAGPSAERYPIASWRDDDLGRPLYRMGDVFDRVKAGRVFTRNDRVSA